MPKREYNDDGIINLAAAVIDRAVRDAKARPEKFKTRSQQLEALRNKTAAITWLMSERLEVYSLGNAEYIRKELQRWPERSPF